MALTGAGIAGSGLSGVTVVLPAGGRGERLAALARRVNKAALKVGRHSLIGRTLDMYAAAGVRRFAVLVGHKAASVRAALGDGRGRGLDIRYALDPPRPVGKGGAIRLALEAGAIPAGPFIVHNPDDQIVRIDRRFPRLIWNRHRALARKGALATAVCVRATAYPYTTFGASRSGLATRAEMYPPVEMPTHIGVTVFSAAAAALFRHLIPLRQRSDFESVILPRLAPRGKLGLAFIPEGTWIPVNDLRGWKALVTAIS